MYAFMYACAYVCVSLFVRLSVGVYRLTVTISFVFCCYITTNCLSAEQTRSHRSVPGDRYSYSSRRGVREWLSAFPFLPIPISFNPIPIPMPAKHLFPFPLFSGVREPGGAVA